MKIKYFLRAILLLSLTNAVYAGNLELYKGKAITPELHLEDMQGKIHDLKDYRGHVVLVQFWATYCPPCRKEMPSMNNLIQKMAGVPFKILAIDMGETREEVIKFINEVKPEFTILMDPDGTAISAWNVFAAPSNFIIDPQGNIHYTLFGGVEWDSSEMVMKLKALATQ
ncbi:MAG: TlpA family protein disulfide reductase [Gammaproteobacteria bacterium]|nr:TlpA family protein disulfide reductase [Gammaproteobacteria bacterium]